jgi:MraZ protein
MHRYFFAGASEAEPDKQGRVMLPATLAKNAEIGREVVVAGVNDHLEIWDRAAWRDHVKVLEGSAEDVAERLASQRD